MGGELTVAIKSGLQKSAKELLLEHQDDLNKQLDNLVDEGKISKTQKEEVLAHLDEVSGIKEKRVKQFQDFIKKWSGKSIKSLTKTEIVDNLRGFTQQANKVADIIESGEFKFLILDEDSFKQAYLNSGGNLNDFSKYKIEAFSTGKMNFFRDTKSVDEFMSEFVHEGTHTLDYLKSKKMLQEGKSLQEIEAILGNNHSYEKRAYFNERAFQIATGMNKDYETIEEMLNHIKYNYEKY